MSNAVTARWHGDNYQARVFWENALNLLVPQSCVVEVTFEANGPKAFDDVVVKYDPAIARSGALKVPADYHQVKWHVEYGGRFGYQDFVDPEFIGAKTYSLLERLRDAKATTLPGSNFTFLTTYRVRDGDPLGPLIAGTDKSLLLPRLFDGTGPRSKMGKVRKLWREHLKLPDDDALRVVLEGFRIFEGHRSLDELRSEITVRAQAVGLLASHADDSDFRFDELARQLKVRQLNGLSRSLLEELCRGEGLMNPAGAPVDDRLPVALRSFAGPAGDIVGAAPEDTLFLTDLFNQRYLVAGREWQDDIRPRVEGFLRSVATKGTSLRLLLEAHASIAFLAGSILDLKSGIDIELVQKGRVGTRVWRADDGASGPPLEVERTGEAGAAIGVFLNITHDVSRQAISYMKKAGVEVTTTLNCSPEGGASPTALRGGLHAAEIADQLTRMIRDARDDDDDVMHLFAACPNSLLFFLGQQHRGLAPLIIYEYDFDRAGNKSYHPSFVID